MKRVNQVCGLSAYFRYCLACYNLYHLLITLRAYISYLPAQIDYSEFSMSH